MRAVSVLEVEEPGIWAELEALAPVAAHVCDVLGPCRRVVSPAFEREVLPRLGGRVLVRHARRDPVAAASSRAHLEDVVARLPPEARRVLAAAQRHALEDVVIGRQAWDPVQDAPAVRTLHGEGLVLSVPGDEPYVGRYRLHPDLPPPPERAYDFSEAVMPETEDLGEARPGPIGLLHDLASLAAALEHLGAKVTLSGTVGVADARRVGRRLGAEALAERGHLEEDPRWGRALRGLEALQVVSRDPISRELHLDLGLEATLAGDTEDACDRLVHRLVERDLHVVVPAVRAALHQAGDGAVDELVFLELLREQHRDVIFPPWRRDDQGVYPTVDGERPRPWDDAQFETVEAPMIRAALARMARFGLLRRAPGVFAGTPDGRRWARATTGPRPPVWVSSDLEVIVPPDAVTPWERFQVERLGRCLQRDVVDRYRLERESLVTWLATHDEEEALALLRRRCPSVPRTVEETIETWARSARRITLVRGVLLPDPA